MLRLIERENKLDDKLSSEYALKYGYLESIDHDFFDKVLKVLVKYGYLPAFKSRQGSKKGGKTTGDKTRGKKKEIPAEVQTLFDNFIKCEPRIFTEYLNNPKKTAFKEHFNKQLAEHFPEYRKEGTMSVNKKGQRLTNKLLSNYKTH